eukprot:237767-Heterocapsa_arctica.AAC.1
MENAATGQARRAWADSAHTSVASETSADRLHAIRSQVAVIADFEARGEKLGIRDMISSEREMEKILTPRKPRT